MCLEQWDLGLWSSDVRELQAEGVGGAQTPRKMRGRGPQGTPRCSRWDRRSSVTLAGAVSVEFMPKWQSSLKGVGG